VRVRVDESRSDDTGPLVHPVRSLREHLVARADREDPLAPHRHGAAADRLAPHRHHPGRQVDVDARHGIQADGMSPAMLATEAVTASATASAVTAQSAGV
jgi:hypothetical protein